MTRAESTGAGRIDHGSGSIPAFLIGVVAGPSPCSPNTDSEAEIRGKPDETAEFKPATNDFPRQEPNSAGDRRKPESGAKRARTSV